MVYTKSNCFLAPRAYVSTGERSKQDFEKPSEAQTCCSEKLLLHETRFIKKIILANVYMCPPVYGEKFKSYHSQKHQTLVWHSKKKFRSSTFPWYCLLYWTRWFLLLRLWTKSLSVTIQIKTAEDYFPLVLFRDWPLIWNLLSNTCVFSFLFSQFFFQKIVFF